MEDKPKGKTLAIIGNANCIGLSTAKRLESEGAYVFTTGRDKKDEGVLE